MKVSSPTKRDSAHLDLIRGLAAVAVMTGHVRGMFLADFKDVASPSLLAKALYGLTGFGNQPVIVFLVLSGYFVGGSVLGSLERWNWKRYLVNRLSRLWVVLIPALLLTAVLDTIGRGLPGGHVYYELPIPKFNEVPIVAGHTIQSFVGTGLFLNTILVRPFGSEMPLWSLALEFWIYILFPLFALAWAMGISRANRFFQWALGVALLFWLRGFVLDGFICWLAGAALRSLPSLKTGRVLRSVSLTLAGAVFLGVVFLSRQGRLPVFFSDVLLSGSFAIWLFCLTGMEDKPRQVSGLYTRVATLLASCSFSVYAMHYPMMMLARSAAGTRVFQPTLPNAVLMLGLCGAIFTVCHRISRLTEANTDRVRDWALGRRVAAVAASSST